jgi:hypothetical protein
VDSHDIDKLEEKNVDADTAEKQIIDDGEGN